VPDERIQINLIDRTILSYFILGGTPLRSLGRKKYIMEELLDSDTQVWRFVLERAVHEFNNRVGGILSVSDAHLARRIENRELRQSLELIRDGAKAASDFVVTMADLLAAEETDPEPTRLSDLQTYLRTRLAFFFAAALGDKCDSLCPRAGDQGERQTPFVQFIGLAAKGVGRATARVIFLGTGAQGGSIHGVAELPVRQSYRSGPDGVLPDSIFQDKTLVGGPGY